MYIFNAPSTRLTQTFDSALFSDHWWSNYQRPESITGHINTYIPGKKRKGHPRPGLLNRKDSMTLEEEKKTEDQRQFRSNNPVVGMQMCFAPVACSLTRRHNNTWRR